MAYIIVVLYEGLVLRCDDKIRWFELYKIMYVGNPKTLRLFG